MVSVILEIFTCWFFAGILKGKGGTGDEYLGPQREVGILQGTPEEGLGGSVTRVCPVL